MIGDVTGVSALLRALADHGFTDKLIRKLAHDNWLNCLHRCLK